MRCNGTRAVLYLFNKITGNSLRTKEMKLFSFLFYEYLTSFIGVEFEGTLISRATSSDIIFYTQ